LRISFAIAKVELFITSYNSVYAATACSVPPQAFAHIWQGYRFAIL